MFQLNVSSIVVTVDKAARINCRPLLVPISDDKNPPTLPCGTHLIILKRVGMFALLIMLSSCGQSISLV